MSDEASLKVERGRRVYVLFGFCLKCIKGNRVRFFVNIDDYL